MPESANPWMTPKEIEGALGRRRSRGVFEDLIYSRKTRRDLLDFVMESTGCNEYAAEDFLREIVKTKEG